MHARGSARHNIITWREDAGRVYKVAFFLYSEEKNVQRFSASVPRNSKPREGERTAVVRERGHGRD